MRLKIYHALRGSHVHCRVFVNGAKSGELVFRKEEFDRLLQDGEQAGVRAGVQVEFEEENGFEAAPTPLPPLTPAAEAKIREDFRAKVFTDADGVRWINGERAADLPPGQMRSRLLGLPGTSEAERVARAAKMAEVFATGAIHIPSRLHEDSTGAIPLSDLAARLSSFKNIEEMADYVGDEGSGALAAASLEPLDYLEGFPDYERVLEARNLTANDMIREFTEFEDHSEADEANLVPRSERLRAFREGFEALERPETAQNPPKTDPNSLLLALFRWGEARAEEEIRLSPKLFALVTEAVFPSGETVLERFLASARVVKPYFRAEVSENGLKLTDLEGI